MKKTPFLALVTYSSVPYMDSVWNLIVTLSVAPMSMPSNSKKDFPEYLPKLISVGEKCRQLNSVSIVFLNLNSVK